MKNKEKIIKKWEKSFKDSGINPETYKTYLEYAEVLVEQKLPIIFSFSHLSRLLGRTNSYLASAVNGTNSHYRSFKIPKKSGGMREIYAPYPAIMQCQYWIIANILSKLPVHEKAFAYVPKKSIKQNAEIHLNQESFLKIDIKDFYPSIKINKIIQVFKSLGYSHQVAFYLAAICCLDGSLPQGAPTSPMLSNIIFKSLDNRLDKLAQKFNLKYSRYADDIAFSGKFINAKFLFYVEKIVQSGDFELNHKKTILQKIPSKRILTGISISSEMLKVPNEYKRKIRQTIHYIEKFGLYSHLSKIRNKNPYYLLSLEGKIHFWLFIEPENEFALKSLQFIKKLKESPPSVS